VSLDGGWFVARAGDGDLDRLRARAALVEQLYGGPLTLWPVSAAGVLAGWFGSQAPVADVWAWGDAHGLTAPALLAADEAALRRFAGPGAAVAWSPHEVAMATATTDVTALYAAGDAARGATTGATGGAAARGAMAVVPAPSAGDAAWSTHAVAAALLARGVAEVRPEAVAERLAFGHLAGDGAAVRGVAAVPAALHLRVDADGLVARAVRPEAERWALLAEDEAQAAADGRLVAAVGERVAGRAALLGLTAGADSRTVAVALQAAGVPFTAFTWGAEDAEDVAGARAVAERLGLEHRVAVPAPLDEAAARAGAGAAAVWSDGAQAGGLLGGDAAPPEATVHLTGMGGEVGRAQYYRLLARSHPAPSRRELLRLWRPDAALPAAMADDARAHVRAAAQAAIDRGVATGLTGWRVLDAVYVQQRMRRWVRDMVRRGPGVLAVPLLDPELDRALISLPLEQRLTLGFHRAFVGARHPDLAPPTPEGQRPGVPPLLRRAAGAVRRRRATVERTDASADALVEPPWRADLLVTGLRTPLAVAALGDELARDLVTDVLDRDPGAWSIAERLQPLTTLADRLATLPRSTERR